jgi:hypothetical protein
VKLTKEQDELLTKEAKRCVGAWASADDLRPTSWRHAQGFKGLDMSELAEGDEVIAYSRGRFRSGVIARVGRKNITWVYVTEGGIKDSLRYGWGVTLTQKVTPKAEIQMARRRL